MSRVSCFGRLQHPTKRKEDLDNAAHACPVVGGPDGSDEIVAVVDEGRGQPRLDPDARMYAAVTR